MDKILGYNNLTAEQKVEFDRIFIKYMSAKGDEARNNIDIKTVEIEGRCFKICYTQWELNGYAFLDPFNNTWY